jgi:hypothetical protein
MSVREEGVSGGRRREIKGERRTARRSVDRGEDLGILGRGVLEANVGEVGRDVVLRERKEVSEERGRKKKGEEKRTLLGSSYLIPETSLLSFNTFSHMM